MNLRLLTLVLALASAAWGHGVSHEDQSFVEGSSGVRLIPFAYLGAKHMVTGYDHLLFLAGVVFFLYRLRDVAVYVSLFAVGHSLTLLLGVLSGTQVNPFLVDMVIRLSVVYKGFDNLRGFERILGFQPNPKAMVFLFGLFHGLGLATKLQELKLSPHGLVLNILSFNVGVELGQILALSGILIFMSYWRRTASFQRQSWNANVLLMTCGFVLMGYQLTGYVLSKQGVTP